MKPINHAWKLLKSKWISKELPPNPYADPKASQKPKLMICPACGGHGQVPVPEGQPDPNLKDAPLPPSNSQPDESKLFDPEDGRFPSSYQDSQTLVERYSQPRWN